MTINPKRILLLLTLASTGILGGALIGQYGFDLHPCDLCIYQRWPHVVVIALGLVYCVRHRREIMSIRHIKGGIESQPCLIKNDIANLENSNKYAVRYLYIMCIALLVGAGIAAYHSGVELGVFEGPDACSAKADEELTLEELRAQIAGAALVSCSQAMAYIFGLSMAAWNALISVGLVIISLVALRKTTRRKAA